MQTLLGRIFKYAGLTALVLNAAALLIFLLGTTAFGMLPSVIQKSPLMFQDFIKYYACGKIALSDQRNRAYEKDVQIDTIRSIIDPLRARGPGPVSTGILPVPALSPQLPKQYEYPIDYPPPVFALMSPLASLPVDAALTVWLMLSIAVASIGVFLLRGRNAMSAFTFILAMAASALSWRTLAMGQMTWLVLGLLAIFFYALLHKRDTMAGIALAFCALKLQYAMFLLVPIIIGRRFWSIAVAAAIVAVFAVVTVIVMGPEAIIQYPDAVARIEGQDPYIASMICIRGLAHGFLSGVPLTLLTVASVLVGLALCGLVWAKAYAGDDEKRKWAVALTVAIALFASPHTHSYDVLLLAIPAALTIRDIETATWRSAALSLKVWQALLFASIPISWLLFKIPDKFVVAQVLCFATMLGVLTVAAYIQFRRAP